MRVFGFRRRRKRRRTHPAAPLLLPVPNGINLNAGVPRKHGKNARGTSRLGCACRVQSPPKRHAQPRDPSHRRAHLTHWRSGELHRPHRTADSNATRPRCRAGEGLAFRGRCHFLRSRSPPGGVQRRAPRSYPTPETPNRTRDARPSGLSRTSRPAPLRPDLSRTSRPVPIAQHRNAARPAPRRDRASLHPRVEATLFADRLCRDRAVDQRARRRSRRSATRKRSDGRAPNVCGRQRTITDNAEGRVFTPVGTTRAQGMARAAIGGELGRRAR